MNYFWKSMPFVRLIIPLIAGIILQFYQDFSPAILLGALTLGLVGLAGFAFLHFNKKYFFRWLQGSLLHVVLVVAGALIVYQKDIKHEQVWVGHFKNDSLKILATLQEPLVAKAKSYKAEASIQAVNNNGQWQPAKGRLLLYFGGDSTATSPLGYGSQVIFSKSLQEIKNSGNPGNFDYRRFNAFKDIYHQVFLKPGEYIIAPTTNVSAFQKWLFDVRDFVIIKMHKYIPGSKEAGVAEALLIGYRDDLDKDLVQAYSNTGVVHIIAISGMHLGMIYAMLVLFFRPVAKRRWARWLKPVVILGVLWVFTLLAGGVPSILRSAVMFSFIILGETIDRKSSVYNTLASSAFVMLCYNPYFLWDIGFQLSYIAVISIVAFSRPVYNWFYVENKLIDFFWKLTSVTISAQILTIPIIFYSFHQFPNLFLLTNCIVVPLSTIVLFAELVVLIVSPLPAIAGFCGIITQAMLRFMNTFIEKMSSYRFAVTDNIQNNLTETILLYIAIISIAYWLINRKSAALFAGITALLCFIIIDAVEMLQVRQQQKMIVYNVPRQAAIDFIAGKQYAFVGDSILMQDGYLRNFHLKPARTLYKISDQAQLRGLFISYPFIQFNNSRILLLDKPYRFESDIKATLDVIIITKNPKISIAELDKVFDCKKYIFDGSNSQYKINKWKSDCDSMHLPCYVCADDGAYEMTL